MWFLRPWKRMVMVLCFYDIILIVAIVLLEWHYLVDIIAGVLVAGVAVAITDFAAVRKTVVSNKAEQPLRAGAPLS
jgi:small basic protein